MVYNQYLVFSTKNEVNKPLFTNLLKYALITETHKRGGNMNQELLAWYQTHYPESSFNGRIQIGFRRHKETALQTLIIRERDCIENFISTMFIRRDYDYYITANTVSGVKRQKEGLFSLQNIVIDIDNHSEDLTYLHYSIEDLLWRLNRDLPDEMPRPTSIVETGRGVQLWWNILPVHAKCKPFFDEVRDEFIRQIQLVIKEYSENSNIFSILGCFAVDNTASCNDVGYFRLPFTYNTKVGMPTLATISENPELFILQDLVKIVKKLKTETLNTSHTIPNTAPILSQDDKDLIQRFNDSEIYILKNVNTLCYFRMKQLISLRKIRNCQVSLETRNNLNFMVYNTLLPVMSELMALEKLSMFNKEFKEPMTNSELQGVIVSAKDKGGYKYSNIKMIEFLQITPEEQDKIGLYASKSENTMSRFSHNPARDAQRALSKESRNFKIQEMSKKGLSFTAISKELGISVSTVSIALNGVKHIDIEKENVIKLIKKGHTTQEILKQTSLSLSTIKRLKTSIKATISQ